jgi:hypothetical protein
MKDEYFQYVPVSTREPLGGHSFLWLTSCVNGFLPESGMIPVTLSLKLLSNLERGSQLLGYASNSLYK